MERYFSLKEVSIIDRKKIVHKDKINVGTYDDSNAVIISKHKHEEVKIELTLMSSGKTKSIRNEYIIREIMNKLEGGIPNVKHQSTKK